MDRGSLSVESQPSVAPTICSALTVAERPVACNRLESAALYLLLLSLHFSVSPAGNQGANRFRKQRQGSSLSKARHLRCQGLQTARFRWDSPWTSLHSQRGFRGTELTRCAGVSGEKRTWRKSILYSLNSLPR